MTSVVVCVVTRDRPEGLKRLLDAIQRLEIPTGRSVRTVVVDNGAAAMAQAVVAGLPAVGPTVSYVTERTVGIPFARNRALLAAGDAELVAFLDDDEEPASDWLVAVLRTLESTAADVVVGPSVPAYADGTPPWVVDGAFFERERFRTGEQIAPKHARTSGVLIRRDSLPPQPVFDTSFRLAGGSDSHLFHRMTRAGKRIVWCDEAVMTEHVPLTRCTAWWLVRRHYRIGNTRSTLLLRLDHPGPARRLRRIGRGLLIALNGTASLCVLHRGTADRVRRLQRVAHGLGLITGALGITYQEYRSVHGV